MDKPTKVLFIDDEPYSTRPYRDRLEENGFEIAYIDSVIRAAETLAALKLPCEFKALIMDLQMPAHDRMTTAQVERYTSLTGLWLLDEYKDQIKAARLPVVVLTQKKPEDFTTLLNTMGLPKLLVRHKIHTPAKELPRHLRAFL